MWMLAITATAIASVVALYLWGAYRWRDERIEKVEEESETDRRPREVDGSGFELEYLMTAEYKR